MYWQIVRMALLLAICCIASKQADAGIDVAQSSNDPVKVPRLTVLYDAFGKDPLLEKDWGYAALVEINGKRILFDAGNDPTVLERNVKAKGVDLSQLDFVVISHRHSDHMGGLSYVLSVNPKVKIYAPKEAFGVFGSSLPSSFYRKAPALAPEQRYYDGAPPTTMRFGTAWPKANIQLVDDTLEIIPGISLISLVSDKPGTLELRELSLAIETPEGLALIVGCSHPGIDRIVEAAVSIDKRIHIVLGGMHLATAPDTEIARLSSLLHEQYRVQWVAPGHCTGEPAFAALSSSFGSRYLYAGLGSVIDLGAHPRRASMDRLERQAMDSQDVGAYRKIRRDMLINFGSRARTRTSH